MNKTPAMTGLALGSLLALGACANAQTPFEAKPMNGAHNMAKAADAKCGAETAKKETTKKADNKCGDAKCGATVKKEVKSAEAKCGEGKCGQ